VRELWGVERAVLFEACERKLTGERERERERRAGESGAEREPTKGRRVGRISS
jgi:hypothetical protein